MPPPSPTELIELSFLRTALAELSLLALLGGLLGGRLGSRYHAEIDRTT